MIKADRERLHGLTLHSVLILLTSHDLPSRVSESSTDHSRSALLMVIPDKDDAFQLIDVILLLLTKRETIYAFTCFTAFSENTINRGLECNC